MTTKPKERQLPAELADAPLDRVVRSLFETSWGEARRWIERGKVTVNGDRVTDGLRPVRESSRICLDLTAARPRGPRDLDHGSVVYLDAQLVVINKPPGISTVPFAELGEVALTHQVQRFLAKHGGSRSGKRRSAMPTLIVVQRLDRGTSGLVVFARSYGVSRKLSEQFRAHRVERKYSVLAHGRARTCTIRSRLLENRGDGLRGSLERSHHRRSRRQRKAKLAVTHVVLERYFPGSAAKGASGGASLVGCRLETGRTNQIRIHLSEAGHPVVGDTLYIRDYEGDLIPAPRLMLHAGLLGFRHPATERRMRFEQPLPKDFVNMLEKLER